MMNWDNLIHAIREDKCVILLGPKVLEIEVDGETQALQPFLLDSIKKNHQRDLMAYYEQDELFLFRNDSSKNESFFTLKSLLDKHTLNGEILQQLTAIRLHLLLSFTPYLNPAETLPKLHIPHEFHYGLFHMKRGSINDHEPTADKPLIYDFFGSIENEESLVLTHADLFEYIRAILGGKELDTGLRSTLQRARYFIFLGFNFEKWYVQLMLRLLMNLKQNHSAYTWVSPQVKGKEEIMDFISNEFDIRVIGEIEGVRDFVERLYQECKKADLLRALPESAETVKELGPYEKVSNWIMNDQLEEAVQYMIEFFEEADDDDSIDQSVALKSRLSRLQKKVSKGILSPSEENLERNKIQDSIQGLSKEIKELV